MENKIFTIYKMPRLSKNQKVRRDTQKLLDEIKSKLNPRTFTSLKGDIQEKRIDAVKRLADKFITLKDSETTSGITKKTFSKEVDEASGLPLVREYNKTGNDTNIKKLSPHKLKNILRNLDIKQKIILQANNTYYTLRTDKINEMIDNIDKFWVDEIQEEGSDAQVIQKVKQLNEITLSRPKWLGKDFNEGAFFPYYNKTEIDLTDFQIFKNKQESSYDENCFVFAIRQSKVLTEEEMSMLKSMCIGLYIPTNKISKICEKFNLYIRVKHLGHHTTKNYGKSSGREIVIGLIDKHYFIVKQIPYTLYSIKHYEEIIDEENWNEIYRKKNIGKWCHYDKDDTRFTNSWEVIKYMHLEADEYLRPIPYEDITGTQYHKEAEEILNLNYHKDAVRKNTIKKVIDKSENAKIVYLDFESITNEEIHKPYMVASSETQTFYGEKCGLYLLRKLYEKFNGNKLILIAHNAGYDFRFLQQHLNMTSLCERGHHLLEGKGMFYYSKGKSIEVILKDSYSVITMPLKKFGKCFNLKQEKEILPYNLYTRVNIDNRYISLDICKVACDMQVRCDNIDRIPIEKDYTNYFDKFLENANKWNCLIVKPDDGGQGVKGETPLIDIIEYSKIYCEKDVEVLKLGYEKFGDMLKESCNLNVVDFMSSAQLAHQYMLNRNVFDNVCEVSSIPRDYIMKCMVGGRTMCANNIKDHIKGRIQDFDAVSLYPSAMYRLGGYLKGEPKVLTELNYEFLKNCDGYFIQIKVNKVNKNYAFPQMSYINDNGVRIFTNEPKENLYVCKFVLEDLIKFHQIEFEIIDGYYYDEGRNNNLHDVIDFVFNERLKMKKEKNPLQEIYKLIMNSAYGKTLQKSHPEKVEFKNENDIDKFIDKNYNYIKSYQELYSEGSFKKYIVKMEKGIEEHFNNAPAGVEVLAMSKRIMNEVMCLAEDNGLKIYYQDTDSMHIKECDIKTLAEKYKQIYHRELIGKGMGQFHSDFDSDIITGNTYYNKDIKHSIRINFETKEKREEWLKTNKGYKPEPEIYATECIFLGKKCYIDKLEGKDFKGNDVVDYHIRMKGISNNAIKHKAKIEQRDFMEIYKSLLECNKELFDLCCGGEKINFEYNSNYTITTKKEFNRVLSFD